jgi:hypothetical protein
MLLSYKYKLPPSNQQAAKFSDWLNMLIVPIIGACETGLRDGINSF